MGPQVPDTFRAYAALCREFAETAPFPQDRASLLAQAELWERDAAIAERDYAAVAASRALLARIDAQLKQMSGALIQPPKND